MENNRHRRKARRRSCQSKCRPGGWSSGDGALTLRGTSGPPTQPSPARPSSAQFSRECSTMQLLNKPLAPLLHTPVPHGEDHLSAHGSKAPGVPHWNRAQCSWRARNASLHTMIRQLCFLPELTLCLPWNHWTLKAQHRCHDVYVLNTGIHFSFKPHQSSRKLKKEHFC